MHRAAQELIGGRLRSKLFINGSFVDSLSGKVFSTINPATGQSIGAVAEAGAEDVDLAVRAARAAFDEGPWPRMDGSRRRNVLQRLADVVEREQQALAAMEALDGGKTLPEAEFDVADCVKTLRYFAGWADKVTGRTIPIDGNYMTMTKREPVGVVGLITPWNYPLLIAVWKLAPALACGCTAVLKPSELTPLSALYFAELALEAGLPRGVLNVVTGFGAGAGAALAEHPAVDKIAFTGSTATGQIVTELSARSVKRVSLELGGKSPLVICDDADFEAALEAAGNGVFMNAGQVCTASSRIFVQSGIYDAFVERVRDMLALRLTGDPFDDITAMGPLISEAQLQKVLAYVATGVREGAELLGGGQRITDDPALAGGFFMQPTAFAGVTDTMTIAKEEIFGPVMCILKFDTIDEVIARANDTLYGLASGIYTADMEKAFLFANRVKAGSVWINAYNVFDAALPFGGYKGSGIGRELGEIALEPYTEHKSIVLALKHKP